MHTPGQGKPVGSHWVPSFSPTNPGPEFQKLGPEVELDAQALVGILQDGVPGGRQYWTPPRRFGASRVGARGCAVGSSCSADGGRLPLAL